MIATARIGRRPLGPGVVVAGLALALGLGASRADAPSDEAAAGARPDRAGRLRLPASGFVVTVPKPYRAETEVFGRVSFRPDGPEVSDDIAVNAPAGAMALSVIVGAASCDAFDAIGGVEKGVAFGKASWSRLDQVLLPTPGLQEGAADPAANMKATVWCRPGLIVHTMASPGNPAVVAWLDALLAVAPPKTARADDTTGTEHIFLESPNTPNEVLLLPVNQRFVLESLGAVWETELPVGRIPPPALAPGTPRPPPRDVFELLTPRAWLVRLELERVEPLDEARCARAKRTPRGFPKAPAGLFWANTDGKSAALCRAIAGGAHMRMVVGASVKLPRALTAAMPIIAELAALFPGTATTTPTAP